MGKGGREAAFMHSAGSAFAHAVRPLLSNNSDRVGKIAGNAIFAVHPCSDFAHPTNARLKFFK